MTFFSDRVRLMARELARSTCDLGDGREVILLLRGSGFTEQEMDMGLEEALEIARADRAIAPILEGRAGLRRPALRTRQEHGARPEPAGRLSMAKPTPIAEDHILILRYLQDGQTSYAQWIAEGCGHAYDTPWAAGRLRSLFNRGLVKRVGRCWCITDAGQAEMARHEG